MDRWRRGLDDFDPPSRNNQQSPGAGQLDLNMCVWVCLVGVCVCVCVCGVLCVSGAGVSKQWKSLALRMPNSVWVHIYTAYVCVCVCVSGDVSPVLDWFLEALPWSCTYKLGVWWSPQSGASCIALGQCLPGVGVRYRWPYCRWWTGLSPAVGSTSGSAASQKRGPQRLKVSW